LSETGSENCGFEEVPVDNLDWSIATSMVYILEFRNV